MAVAVSTILVLLAVHRTWAQNSAIKYLHVAGNGPIKFNKHFLARAGVVPRLRCDMALSIGLSNRSFFPPYSCSQSFPSLPPRTRPPVLLLLLICCQIMFTSVIQERADCARDSSNTRVILRTRDYKWTSSDGNLLVFCPDGVRSVRPVLGVIFTAMAKSQFYFLSYIRKLHTLINK